MENKRHLSKEELSLENERLYTVLNVNTILSSNLRLDAVLNALLDKASEVCLAEASSLMLLDDDTEELYFYTIRGDKEKQDALKKIRLKIGEGIAGWVAEKGEAVLVENATEDMRFSRKADQKSNFQTRTMMCVPIKIKDRILGTIQALNRIDGFPFNQSDLSIFTIFANQAAIAIENARLHEMATVDAMTGLYMKSFFMARLSEEYKRAVRSKHPVSLIMSDIDFFKKVNDKFGHQGGDTALVELAKVINETVISLKSEDIAGRYGEKSFVFFFPTVIQMTLKK